MKSLLKFISDKLSLKKETQTKENKINILPQVRGVNPLFDIELHLPNFKAEIIFDVGANIGQSTSIYINHFKKAEIYCFEPVISTYSILENEFKQYNNIHCFNIAFGAKKGIGNMILHNTSDLAQLTVLKNDIEDVSNKKKSYVMIETIDEFCRDNNINQISYLKIDTEGHDLNVLQGAIDMINNQKIGIIEVEVGMNQLNTLHVPFEIIWNYLLEKNYYLFGIYEQVHEWPTGSPILRRINPVFISEEIKNRNIVNK
ncbi:MAG: FkbM family methyltransferase [Bacteroidales bacterium]